MKISLSSALEMFCTKFLNKLSWYIVYFGGSEDVVLTGEFSLALEMFCRKFYEQIQLAYRCLFLGQ